MAYTVGLTPKGASGYAPIGGDYSAHTSPNSSNSTCACEEGGTSPIDATPGLSVIDTPTGYPLVIDQGVAFSQKICLTKGDITVPAIELSAGPDGKLTFPTSQEICVVAGDTVRVLGFDPCKPDANEIFTVASVVNTDTEKSVTLTGFNTGGTAKTYKQVTQSTTSEQVLGCISATAVVNNNSGPRIMQHLSSQPKFTLSGGATARSDWSQSFGIEFAGNNQWVMSRITGLVKPGDTLISEDAGILTPVDVLEVRPVGTSDGSTVEKIKLAIPPANTGCFLAHIRRGRLFNMNMAYDANGCIDLKLPASATAGLQLLEAWKVSDDSSRCETFNIGCYTVAMHWSETNAAGQVQPMSRILLRGDVYLRASHIFNNAM